MAIGYWLFQSAIPYWLYVCICLIAIAIVGGDILNAIGLPIAPTQRKVQVHLVLQLKAGEALRRARVQVHSVGIAKRELYTLYNYVTGCEIAAFVTK